MELDQLVVWAAANLSHTPMGLGPHHDQGLLNTLGKMLLHESSSTQTVILPDIHLHELHQVMTLVYKV
jgi:hypothetical protein